MSSNKKTADASDSDEEEIEVNEESVHEPEVEEDATLANPDVITKYQEAAKIAQFALGEVVKMCVAGAKIADICKAGDELIEQRTQAIFKNKNKHGKVVMRGVAFPVCISVNELVCHVSPLESDETFPPLAANDLVKIDMGVHIDGFIAAAAHTLVVGADPVANLEGAVAAVSGSKADVINAAWIAAEVAVKMVKAGNTNSQVTAAIKQVADAFNVRPISGTLMHQMKQFVIDANKMIILREEPEHKVEACTFETGEVFAVDIVMSSGEGKPKETGMRTTVFKRAVDKKYSLKNKTSRTFFNEINKKYPTLPFSIRSLPDEKAAKLGVRECVTHELLLQYPILQERRDDFIGHFKFTVLLLPSGTVRITGLPPVTYSILAQSGKTGGDAESSTPNVALALAQSLIDAGRLSLPESVLELLREVKPENKKKAKKAAKKAAAAAEAK